MAERHLLERAERRLQPNQRCETFGFQCLIDCPDPVCAFGMARRHRMLGLMQDWPLLLHRIDRKSVV